MSPVVAVVVAVGVATAAVGAVPVGRIRVDRGATAGSENGVVGGVGEMPLYGGPTSPGLKTRVQRLARDRGGQCHRGISRIYTV